MATRFHSKFHRHNHHTDATQDVRYPDSSYDPIASHDSPFRGAFVLNGSLSAYTSLSAFSGYFANPNTALALRAGVWALVVDQGNTLVKDLTCTNIVITQNFTLNGDAFFKSNVDISKNLTVDTDTLFVDSGLRRVGIKTLKPNQALTVTGSISSTQGLYGGRIFEANPITSRISLRANTDITGELSVTGSTTLDSTLFVDGITTLYNNLDVASNTLFVDANNRRVGINTTTPDKEFVVFGETRCTDAVIFEKNFYVDSSVFFVDSDNDRVGINTLNPNEALTVNGNVSATQSLFVTENAFIGAPAERWSSASYYGVSRCGQIDEFNDAEIAFTSNGYRNANNAWSTLSSANFGFTGAAQIALNASGVIDFRTENLKEEGSSPFITNRLRITPDGKVCINTTSPQEQLTVDGSIYATNAFKASALFVDNIDIAPNRVNLISNIRTFTTPVTATGDFLIVKVNHQEKAIRLWNF